MHSKKIQLGFLIAGLSNIIAVPLFSRLFTNQPLMNAQPEIMGMFGLLAIMLWGFAYIAVRKKYMFLPWLIAVFAIEKLAYVIAWIGWHSHHSISELLQQDTFAGIFFYIYGVNDFIFLLFFLYVFFKTLYHKERI